MYPVPDLNMPFGGIHLLNFNRISVSIGPTATLALEEKIIEASKN